MPKLYAISPHPMHVTWSSPSLFTLRIDRRGVEQRFGPPSAVDCDSNGIGLFDAWDLRFACGLEVGLSLFHSGAAEVHASKRDADHILFHLGAASIARWTPDVCPPVVPAYRVLRRDDNGGTFEVARFTSRCEAEAAAQRFEQRGHKQTYWVEAV